MPFQVTGRPSGTLAVISQPCSGVCASASIRAPASTSSVLASAWRRAVHTTGTGSLTIGVDSGLGAQPAKARASSAPLPIRTIPPPWQGARLAHRPPYIS
jgi:hypothetical protein